MAEGLVLRGTMRAHTDSVTAIATPIDNSDMIVTTSRDKSLILWHLTKDDQTYGVPRRRLTGHSHFVQYMVLSFDGRFGLSGSWDGELRLWDLAAFHVLARILAELKLPTPNVGRIFMSAAAVNDIAAWILLALAVALSGDSQSPLVSLWVFLCGCGLVICATVIVPPIFKWIAQRCHEGEPIEETYICATLVAVLAVGFVTDVLGIHAMFGSFVIGVLIPKD